MMRKGIIPLFISIVGFQLALAGEVKKSYKIPQGWQISIENYLGNIRVTSCKGKEIELTAFIDSPGSESVTIADERFDETIRIYPRFVPFAPPKEYVPPKPFAPPKEYGPSRGLGMPMNPIGPARGRGFPTPVMAPPVKVDIEIGLPQSVKYKIIRIITRSGKVDVSNVEGQFFITSERGNVELKSVKGGVTASSVNGNISVSIEHAQERPMNFSSISGNVEVVAPKNLDAMIDMLSRVGLLKTDFPLDITERRYMGKFAKGKLGNGLMALGISSNSGRVSLLQK